MLGLKGGACEKQLSNNLHGIFPSLEESFWRIEPPYFPILT